MHPLGVRLCSTLCLGTQMLIVRITCCKDFAELAQLHRQARSGNAWVKTPGASIPGNGGGFEIASHMAWLSFDTAIGGWSNIFGDFDPRSRYRRVTGRSVACNPILFRRNAVELFAADKTVKQYQNIRCSLPIVLIDEFLIFKALNTQGR